MSISDMVYKHRLAMLIFVQNSVICQPSEPLLYIFFAIFFNSKKNLKSSILNILENNGYISKTESVSGRKTFKISITDEGRKVYEQVKPTILKIWSYTCKDIPEEKVDAFFEILSEIKKNLLAKVNIQI